MTNQEITNDQMLTDIVRCMVNGGGIKHIGRKHLINIMVYKEDSIRITRYKKDPKEKIKVPVIHTSFRLLLLNGDAMKAVLGDDRRCLHPKGSCAYADCEDCEESQANYIYHGLKAAELLLNGEGINKAITYVYNKMEERG